MKVIQLNELGEPTGIDGPLSITIGNFDGIHSGHRLLIEKTKLLAKKLGTESAALTFYPHPEEFFMRHQKSEEMLFTLDQKIRAMKEAGLENLIIQSFHDSLAHLSHRSFLHDYLIKTLKARAIVVGENFRFGHKRLGDSEYLREECESENVVATTVPAAKFRNDFISSTRIRKSLLHNGSVESAEAMLQRPYMLEGVVKRGDQFGRKMGFPTINLAHINQLIPANGVYAGWVWCKSRSTTENAPILSSSADLMLAVINIGSRPSIKMDQAELRVEAHIINEVIGDNELYNEPASVYLCQRLREEMSFKNIEDLKSAIRKNKEQTIQLQSDISF